MPVVLVLAELGPVFLAVMALLILYAATLLVAPITYILRQLPFIGGEIAGLVDDGMRAMTNAMGDYIAGQLQGVTDLVDFVSGSLQWMLRSATDGITSLWGAFFDAMDALGSSVGFIQKQLQGIQRDAQRALAQITALAQSVTRDVANLANALSRVIPDMIARAVATVQSWVRGIERDLQREMDHAVSAVRGAILAIVAQQMAALTRLVTDVQKGLQDAIGDVARQAQGQLQGLERRLQGDIDGLTHDLQHLLDGVGTIVGPLTLVQIITQVLTRLRDIERCNDPMCGFLTPQLPALNAIQDAALLAAVAALVAAAVNDPAGAHRASQATMGPVIGTARSIFGETVGRA